MLFRFPYVFLLAIAVVAFVIRAYNLSYNSIFVDEAFYIVIGQDILAGKIVEVYGAISWVGAFPFIYPLFSGIFYSLGGIIGTRLLNVELGTICVVLVFLFTRSLNLFSDKRSNNIAGLVAASLLATTAVPIQLSRIAIYDMLSFTIFLLGLIFYLKAFGEKNKKWYFLAAVTIFVSYLAKYITLIYIPIFIVSGWFVPEIRRKNFTFYFSVPLFIFTSLYILINLPNLLEYFSGQVGDTSTTQLDVLNVFWQASASILGLAIVGAAIFWKEKKESVMALLFMAAVPVLLHTFTTNNTSSEQHAFLVLIFLFPLVAAFFTYLITKSRIVGITVTVMFVILNFFYSYPQVRAAENFWPNSEAAIAVIKKNVSSGDVILAEGSDTVFLGLGRKIPIEQVVGPFVFEYKNLEGIGAYLKAIDDRYFKLVELESVYFSEEDMQKIEERLELGYTKIFDDGKIRVYQRL